MRKLANAQVTEGQVCPGRRRWVEPGEGGGARRSQLSFHSLVSAGSYYLTTTYGALEHIKNYDKITVTRQLSMEVQDSIHRWERRRTLNKARASRSSVQVTPGTRAGGAGGAASPMAPQLSEPDAGWVGGTGL